MSSKVFDSPKFKNWKQQIENSGTKIEKMEVLGSVFRQKQELFCALIDTKMLTPEGNLVPRCILLRGISVVVIPVFHCTDGQIYTLLVKQRRPVDGQFTLEFPGGFLDKGDESPSNIAAMEVREELGLEIGREMLVSLNPEPISVCTALLDEKIHFFYFEKQCSKLYLDSLHNRQSGIASNGEYLQVSVMPMRDTNRIYNSSVIIGVKLLENYLGRTF